MDSVFLILGGFLLAICISEMVLKGTKLQTGLTKVMLVHGIVAGLLLVYLVVAGRMEWPTLIIFWAGAFLTWFGVRSHMESSILLRMLYLLRRRVIPEDQLLNEYESHYGESQRLEELYRGGLLEKSVPVSTVTPKGKLILRIVSYLSGSQTRDHSA